MPTSSKKIEPFGSRPAGMGLTEQEYLLFDPIALANAVASDSTLKTEANRIVCFAIPMPEEALARLEHWATSLLRELGLPDRQGNVEVGSDGTWRWWDDGSPQRKPKYCCTAYSYIQGRGEHTKAWFAGKILENIDLLTQSVPLRRKIVAAIQLGGLERDYWWKFTHEAAALEGHRLREGRRRGQPRAAATTSAHARYRVDVLVAVVQSLWKEQPRLRGRYSATAREIAAKKVDGLRLGSGRMLGITRMRKIISEADRSGRLPLDVIDFDADDTVTHIRTPIMDTSCIP